MPLAGLLNASSIDILVSMGWLVMAPNHSDVHRLATELRLRAHRLEVESADDSRARYQSVDMRDVCHAMAEGRRVLGISGLLSAFVEAMSDSSGNLIGHAAGAMGGLSHLVGAWVMQQLLLREPPHGGQPARILVELFAGWTTRDSTWPLEVAAPLHAAVWTAVAMAPHRASGSSRWVLGTHLCGATGESGDQVLRRLHCWHGFGHGATLAAIAETDGMPYTACAP